MRSNSCATSGKHFTVNAMLAKESVKRRIESEDGISYTEFSYSLLQAYDFLVLHDRFGCTLQMGGSDQWGNITAGMDLIRRVRGGKAHGLVMPLVTTASGTKFGKTEAGTIWLDPALTKPYEFYQFWLNVDDRDAVKYLKFFTFLDERRIGELEAATRARAGAASCAAHAGARGHAARARRRRRCAKRRAAAEKLFKGDLTIDVGRRVASGLQQRPVVADAVSIRGVAGDGLPRVERGHGIEERGGAIDQGRRRLHQRPARGRMRSRACLRRMRCTARYFVVRKGKKDNFLVRVDKDVAPS